MREIGSEYWLEEINCGDSKSFEKTLLLGDDRRFLFSGRTAIDYVLRDIVKPIKKVYMPSYCCDSMLQPFINRDISIEFYDVFLDIEGIRYTIDYEKEVDIFFATSYFGFSCTTMDTAIEKFKKKNIIVIEDITHRLLSEQNFSEKADYLIASLRKWFAIPTGGIAIKQYGRFTNQYLTAPDLELVNKKIKAMNLKANYFKNFQVDINKEATKNNFLGLFSEFNSGLIENYMNLTIDELSEQLLYKININEIKKKRRNNAEILYGFSKQSEHIRFLIEEPDLSIDCPLFIPIIVKEDLRNSLKKHLAKKDIFCPNHWPIPSKCCLNEITVKPYNEELSLICDQRYGQDDIKRLLDTLGEFIETL